jgi:hypothetical protein
MHAGRFFRRLVLVLIATVLGVSAAPATATPSGVSPAQLTAAGWDCFNGPRPFNPKIHCSPPGQLELILSEQARSAIFLTFDTEDPTAEDASLLGTERLIRADLFQGQPCPTDPPSLEYSHLGPRLGWDYYICHTFDSPW